MFAPVIVSIHGGALMEGDKAEQTFVGERFASEGIVTAGGPHRAIRPQYHRTACLALMRPGGGVIR